MRAIFRSIGSSLLLLDLVAAKSFLEAIAPFPELSQFKTLLERSPDLAPVLTNIPNIPSTQEITVLVPSNLAFDRYRASHKVDISQIPKPDLEALLQYHILTKNLPSAQFLNAPPPQLVIPSQLTGEKYNNRSAGPALQSNGGTGDKKDGQVVIFNVGAQAGGSKRDVNRVTVKSGLNESVNLTVTDGTWDGGIFQIVDGFLTLPQVCTITIQNRNLTALTRALDRAALSSTLDHLRNVTCIGPTDEAFLTAGSPDVKASTADLTSALTYHTLTQPVYANFLQDGQTFTSVSNATIRVTLNSTGIWFNDAKLIATNVLTNNGLIHVVDKVMSAPSPASSSPAPSSTSAAPSASPSKAAASNLLQMPSIQISAAISQIIAVLLVTGVF